MNILTKAAAATEPLAQKMAPLMMKASAKSPEILLGTGVVLILGGTAMACRATLKSKEIIEDGLDEAESHMQDEYGEYPDMTEEQYAEAKNAIAKTHIHTGLKVAQKFALPVILTGSGIACIVISHNIQAKRLAVAIAAADAWQLAFEDYRRRVIEDQGPAADARYMNGDKLVKATFYETDPETGKDKKVKKEIVVRDGGADPYMIPFNEYTCTEYPQNKDLFAAISMADDASVFFTRKLLVKGRLFLWQVYEYFGHKYTPISGAAGWVLGGDGDDEVVISVDEVYTQEELDRAHDEKRSPKPELWLRFNCDGSIINIPD